MDSDKNFSLYKIKLEDLDLTGYNPYDDDFALEIDLSNDNWIHYELDSIFKMKNEDIFYITFKCFGNTTSLMEVEIPNKSLSCSYEYPTNIFKDNIIKYMKKYVNSRNNNHTFSGLEDILNFYNEVIEEGSVRFKMKLDVASGVYELNTKNISKMT